ncbi:hypothetical protein C0995_012847 [Termitomyces sp. Mi166|nr:hypothetical protein C0995_012847 [Termitomyces sp. Mi166\
MTMWPDLRDHLLQDIMTRLSLPNPAAPITTLVSESLPASDSSFTAAPRQYDTLQNGLRDLKFNWEPKNRFSVETIWHHVDYLAATDFYGMPAVRHIVIVAASAPFDDTFGLDPTTYSGSSRWHQLALKISQAHIQCHLVLSSSQDMRPLAILFEEAPMSQRAGLLPRRNNSFPLPSHANVDDNMYSLTSPTESENPPSLVTQLQQVHGLTKKKVYGAKPVHTPFVREERVRKEPPCAPAPLILPSVKSTGGGRALSTSKASRISRVAQSSPTELQARRPNFPRRNSRLSSPETDSYPSPTSYTAPSNISSPVSPTSLVNIYMQPAPSHLETSLDPSWGTPEYKPQLLSLQQSPLSPSHFPTLSAPTRPLADPWQDSNINVSQPVVSPTVTGPTQFPVRYDSPSRPLATDSRRISSGAGDATSQSLPRRSCLSDDEPFTFSAEYVAATATMFKNEVLPAYPELQSAFPEVMSPRRAFFVAQDQSSTPSPESSYDPGELYISAEREELRQQSFSQSVKQPAPGANSPGFSYGATSYSPGSSSSLTGWAG